MGAYASAQIHAFPFGFQLCIQVLVFLVLIISQVDKSTIRLIMNLKANVNIEAFARKDTSSH